MINGFFVSFDEDGFVFKYRNLFLETTSVVLYGSLYLCVNLSFIIYHLSFII